MAKRFRFSLQAVLGHREYLQEQAQIALSQALAIVTEHQATLKLLEEEFLEQELARPNGGSSERILVSIQYLAHLTQAIAGVKQLIVEAEENVVRARQALVERTRDTKALELLREHQQQEFHKAANVKETKILDDFGGQMFLRAESRAL